MTWTACDDTAHEQRLWSERARLARYRRTRDPRLRATIIEEHLSLARKVASRYSAGSDDDDVFQVACLGLVKAVDRFDPARGVAFSSYAVPTMAGEVRRHFRDYGWGLHVNRQLQELVLSVHRARNELERDLGRKPTVAEVAGALSISVDAVSDALDAASARRPRSLDAPAPGSLGAADEPVVSQIGHEDPGYAEAEHRAVMRELARTLSQRQRLMLRLRLADDLSQRQIARKVGVSQMTVSRVLATIREQLAFSEPLPKAQLGGQQPD
jgi:RNA polymerase sigma-B factor